jgi:surfeit locus 1 family protein
VTPPPLSVGEGRKAPRSARIRILAAAALLLTIGFVALGVWQIQRRAWKHALIAQVEARIHATPVDAPGPAEWRSLGADGGAYRRVRIAGHYGIGRDTLVQAVTERGSGYWVMAPLASARGFVVLVNRGFVPAEPGRPPRYRPSAGTASITGLVRPSEPHGGFLRSNDPAADRWYSRDVAAIAASRVPGAAVAPYFIDADADGPRDAWPAGGMTVIRFADNHLVYALTWFTLAILSAGGYWRMMREPSIR